MASGETLALYLLRRFLIKRAVLTGAVVGVGRRTSSGRPHRLPPEFQILLDVLGRIYGNINGHARYLRAVEFDRQVIVAVTEIGELIPASIPGTLPRHHFISSCIENDVVRPVCFFVTRLRGVNSDIAIQREVPPACRRQVAKALAPAPRLLARASV